MADVLMCPRCGAAVIVGELAQELFVLLNAVPAATASGGGFAPFPDGGAELAPKFLRTTLPCAHVLHACEADS